MMQRLAAIALVMWGSTAHAQGLDDEPGAPRYALQPAKPPVRTRVSIAPIAGMGWGAVFFGPDLKGAYVGGDLRLLWSRGDKPWGFGVRFAGTASVLARGRHVPLSFGSEKEPITGGGHMYSAEIGFLFDTHGFWVSHGVSMGYYSLVGDATILPEAFVALGYDIPLGQYLAIRLSTTGALLATVRAQVGGGLVARF